MQGRLSALCAVALLMMASLPLAASDSKTAIPDVLPVSLSANSAVWAGSRAYIFGGSGSSGLFTNILEYDPIHQSVRDTGAVFSTPSGAAAVWTGSKALIFGGYNGNPADTIVEYVPATNAVTVLPAKLPSPRNAIAAVWSGDAAYIFGGVERDEILKFDPMSGTISTLPVKLPSARYWTSAAWLDGRAYVVGGHPYETIGKEVLIFDPTNMTVVRGPDLPRAHRGPAVVSDGHNVFVIGGDTTGDSRALKINSTRVTTMSSVFPWSFSSAVWTGREIVQFGGVDFNGPNGQIRYSRAITHYSLAPSAPTNVQMSANFGGRQIEIEWTPPPDSSYSVLTGYHVYRKVDDEPWTRVLSPGNVSPARVPTVPNATNAFRMTALNDARDESVVSAATTVSMPADVPLSATVKAAPGVRDGSVHITWTPPLDDGGDAITAYRVYTVTHGNYSHIATLDGNARDLTFFPDSNDAAWYTVGTLNSVGESDLAQAACAVPSGILVLTTEPCPASAPWRDTVLISEEREFNASQSTPPTDLDVVSARGARNGTFYDLHATLVGQSLPRVQVLDFAGVLPPVELDLANVPALQAGSRYNVSVIVLLRSSDELAICAARIGEACAVDAPVNPGAPEGLANARDGWLVATVAISQDGATLVELTRSVPFIGQALTVGPELPHIPGVPRV